MIKSLPKQLYSCSQTRTLDNCAIEQHGLSGRVLMKRAGRAAYQLLAKRWPSQTIWVLCGSGNNAGDGYIVAAMAALQKRQIALRYLSDPTKLRNDAQAAYRFALQEGVEMYAFDPDEHILDNTTVIVDALLGTGLRGALRENYASAIHWINQSKVPVLALDIPSGICADTGSKLERAVKADATITFIACKQGLLTGSAPACVGDVYFNDLDVPKEIYAQVNSRIKRITLESLPTLTPRAADAHKGLFGHVLVIGGDHGFGGASIMAAESALALGAGKVSLATRPEHTVAALVRRPELMVRGIHSEKDLTTQLKHASVLVAGPGLGRSSWSELCLKHVLQTSLPIVLDADGLNLLAGRRDDIPLRKNWVLTPHPAEAARLLGLTTSSIQADRFSAARKLQQKYGGVIVLKGAGTIITDGSDMVLANVGNAAMATPGSGDILSGLIGSFVAQGLPYFDAAKLGVCVHGRAGELAAKGRHSLCATELIECSRKALESF